MLSVRVTTWPAFRSPLPVPSMPLPDVPTVGTVGAVVSGVDAAAGTTIIWFASALGASTLTPWTPAPKTGELRLIGLVVELEGSGCARIRGSVDDPTTEWFGSAFSCSQ